MDQLTLDSIAAQKAGMSYGKWKVLHPHTKGEAVLDNKQTKLCRICGREIPYRHSGSGAQSTLFCSPQCAYEGQKARARANYHKRKERMMADGKI